MREGQEGDVDIKDVRKPVFQALLYFTYTDQLPEVWQHNGNTMAFQNTVYQLSSVAFKMAKQGCFCIVLTHVCRLIVHMLLTYMTFGISSSYMYAPVVLRYCIHQHATKSGVQQLVTHKHTVIVGFVSDKSGVQQSVTLSHPHSAACSSQ